MLDRDVLVLHPLGLGLRGVEDLVELRAHRELAAGGLGEDVQPLLGGLQDLVRIHAKLRKQRPNDLLLRVQKRHQQVHRLQPRVPTLLSQGLRFLHSLLALERELLETKCHDRLVRKDLLLLFELDVDHVFGLASRAICTRRRPASALAAAPRRHLGPAWPLE